MTRNCTEDAGGGPAAAGAPPPAAAITAPATKGRGRIEWLDRSKGAGIFLVVFGHCWLGLASAGILTDAGVIHTVERLIYSFHMPLFFLLSGYTFERWAARRTPSEAFKDRCLRLLWPLFLWHYIFAGARFLAGDAANTPGGLNTVISLPLPPVDHFWFLWALFLVQLIVWPLVRLIALPRGAWIALAAVTALLVAIPGLPLGPLTVGAALHLPIFLVGIALARMSALPATGWYVVAAVAVFILLDTATLALPPVIIVRIAVAACLSIAFVVLMNALPSGRITSWLDELGRQSMPIFLAHTLFTAATRIGLSRVTDATLPHLLVGTAFGLAGPIALYHLTRRIMPPRLIGF